MELPTAPKEKEGKEVTPSFIFTILKHQRDLQLHIEEAIAIKKIKPTLNCRLETLSAIFLNYYFSLVPSVKPSSILRLILSLYFSFGVIPFPNNFHLFFFSPALLSCLK